MKFENLHQPPFETTLMGVVRAVLDHYGIPASDATVYGGSGHAFLVNVHEQLCPSGPYCWKPERVFELLGNLGLRVTELGFFLGGSTRVERGVVEARVREHLDAGRPCSLLNMEHQVISGYDEHAFTTARPWPGNPDFPPGTLTFGEWSEFGDETHADFLAWDVCEPADAATVLRDSLQFAVDLCDHPEEFELEGYGIGPRAWANWIAAAPEHGASHGNWWNATVWGECRRRAAEYFAERGPGLPGDAAALARELSAEYQGIAGLLARLADRELAVERKVACLEEIRDREGQAVDRIRDMLEFLV